MTGNRAAGLIGGLVFLCLAALSLYRLLIGFPISIGGMELGQTASFFGFVVFAALALMMFRGSRGS